MSPWRAPSIRPSPRMAFLHPRAPCAGIGRRPRWRSRPCRPAFRWCCLAARITGSGSISTVPSSRSYEDELRHLAAQLGISEVVFLGHVDDIPGFLDSIDILVHASTKPEPLGQTVLQGLAYAKPIIATEGGGPSEWIDSGVNGLLVPPDQPDALAVALRELANSYELRTKLAAAAAQTKGILTDDECVAAHAEFFRAVRQAHRAKSGRRLR